MDLAAIQQALRERNIDAWLFYDHHHRDPISYRVLGLPDGLMVTRRWYYLIPAQGEPLKLVHKIESGHLDTLPGTKKQYAGWEELFSNLKQMLAPHRDIAMQYSPNNFVFTISMVDAGTADMIRGLGKNIVSAADLIARFEATLSDEQIKSHFAARDVIDKVTAEAFREIGRRVRSGGTHEHEIQQFFMEAFEPVARFRFVKATLFCWMYGRKRRLPALFFMTLHGSASWARLHQTGSAKFSRSLRTRAIWA
jgi:Xaa-Pro dipeptidase